jgi:hypothetical protein
VDVVPLASVEVEHLLYEYLLIYFDVIGSRTVLVQDRDSKQVQNKGITTNK